MSAQLHDHIEHLRNHRHITFVKERIENTKYEVGYTPKEAGLLFANLILVMEMSFEKQYPDHPPILRFLTPIYHLNVEEQSQNLLLPILADDWSPFLNLTTIIDCLDTAFAHPDLHSPASVRILQEYQKSHSTYLAKVTAAIEALRTTSKTDPTRTIPKADLNFSPDRNPAFHLQNNANNSPKPAISTHPEPLNPLFNFNSPTEKFQSPITIIDQFQTNSIKAKEVQYQTTSVVDSDNLIQQLRNVSEAIEISMNQCSLLEEKAQAMPINSKLKQILQAKAEEQLNVLLQMLDISTKLKNQLISRYRQ